MRSFARLCLIPLLVSACPSPAAAAWPNSPFTNRALCTAANSQQSPMSVSDGAGGVIVTWQDLRSGNLDIYAQHVLASGVADPAWPANGRALCTAANNQSSPTIASDGAGGAVVAWQDQRTPTNDIYAQHVLASGAVDGAWPANGRALCVAVNDQTIPTIVSDGLGGAIVTWQDNRTPGAREVYAQRVLASGAVDGAWPVDGRGLCTAGWGETPTIVSDGAGGAIVTWQDQRGGGGSHDVYAQHVLASGAVDGVWPVNGRGVCLALSASQFPTIVSDGAGGAIITWHDYRNGLNNIDIFAQHVLSSGAVDGAWPVDGRSLCAAASQQTNPVIVADGAGGAIVTWNDQRFANYDIFAQHVLATGLVDGAWPAEGRAVCTVAGQQSNVAIAPDGAGGAIVTWHDFRNGNFDTYAQHLLATGAVDGVWPADGRALSTAAGEQSWPTIVSDGAGGAIVAFQDVRTGSFDIYAQRVARYGYLGTPEGELVGATDVPGDQGGRVKLSWNASYLESEPYNLVTSYRVYRSVPPNVAASIKSSGVRITRAEEEVESFVLPGELLTTSLAGTIYYWEYLAAVPADFLPNYSYLAATAQDSTAAGALATAFMVQARTAGSQHWESQPMSGYSVDNLPPAAPQALTGQYSAGNTSLHWYPNSEADLAGYRLYRGTSASFVPGPGNLVAALADTGHVDAAGVPSYYKLTAVDSHGNESLVATLTPAGTTAVGDAALAKLAFAVPSPNPADVRTTLQYTLPRAGVVRMEIYDASGRLVRELASGTREAGPHAEAWNLRDASGRSVGAGLYFARLKTEFGTMVRRVAVTR